MIYYHGRFVPFRWFLIYGIFDAWQPTRPVMPPAPTIQSLRGF